MDSGGCRVASQQKNDKREGLVNAVAILKDVCYDKYL